MEGQVTDKTHFDLKVLWFASNLWCLLTRLPLTLSDCWFGKLKLAQDISIAGSYPSVQSEDSKAQLNFLFTNIGIWRNRHFPEQGRPSFHSKGGLAISTCVYAAIWAGNPSDTFFVKLYLLHLQIQE